MVIPSATIVNNISDSCKKPQRMTVWDWCSVDHDWQDLNVTVWLQQYPQSDILKRLLWLKQGRAEFGQSQYIFADYNVCLAVPTSNLYTSLYLWKTFNWIEMPNRYESHHKSRWGQQVNGQEGIIALSETLRSSCRDERYYSFNWVLILFLFETESL